MIDYFVVLTQRWFSSGTQGWMIFLYSLHLTVVFFVFCHLLRRRREATSAWFWLLLTWLLPILGAILYLMFGITRIPAKIWRKAPARAPRKGDRHRRDTSEAQLPLAYWQALDHAGIAEPVHPWAGDLNHALNGILPDLPLLGGNRIEPLVTGDEAFPRMLAAIRSARHHIHFQSFIVGSDTVGRMFMDALAEKARAGVRVRFLYDRFGSTPAVLRRFFSKYEDIPNFQIADWSLANPLKQQVQFNLRNHRKTLVVDGEKAFMGGINLDEDHITCHNRPPIRDYHFELHGPVVLELQYTFIQDWYCMTDEDPEVLMQSAHFPQAREAGRTQARVINSGPTHPSETGIDAVFALITSARRQLLIVTPYFVPTTDILRAIRLAALRGVDTRLVVPAVSNHFFAGWAGRALYEELMQAGVRIYERRPPFIHAKALVVDDTAALVGTTNLDVRSLRVNYETNLVVFGAPFIDDLKRIVLEDLASSDEIQLEIWRKRPRRRRVIENFWNLFAPQL
jgi:cardiolipin synthase